MTKYTGQLDTMMWYGGEMGFGDFREVAKPHQKINRAFSSDKAALAYAYSIVNKSANKKPKNQYSKGIQYVVYIKNTETGRDYHIQLNKGKVRVWTTGPEGYRLGYLLKSDGTISYRGGLI